MTLFPDIIQDFKKFRVAVVGDLMLDRYVHGTVDRISQEAPVPVVKVTHEAEFPGGAANVARNLTSLGAQAEIFGFVGDDAEAPKLLNILHDYQVETSGVIQTRELDTIVKTRVLAGNQQVVRIDRERTVVLSDGLQRKLAQRLEARLASGELDAVILEDYAKGLFTRSSMRKCVELCNQYHVLVALDPHSSHPFHIPGINLMTPNRSEAFTLANVKNTGKAKSTGPIPFEDKLRVTGRKLLSQWGVEQLLVTLGPHGMALFARNTPDSYQHIPTIAQQVFDVSGAGDTVMATAVLGLLAQAGVFSACAIANVAASIVVGRVGTAAVTPQELTDKVQDFKDRFDGNSIR